jgi:DNA primase
MATWISFKELREKVRIAEVLRQYNVQLKVRGEKATGFCPLPTHPIRSDGKKRTASFSVHLGKGIWQCFGCGAKGNVLDLGARLRGLNPEDPAQLRKAALKLAEIFGIKCEQPNGRSREVKPAAQSAEPAARAAPVASPVATDPAARVLVNEPIDFELRNLDPNHAYLTGRGFEPQTINHFGLGFCSRGMMKDRIAIPIHDPAGRLVGYAGRLVDDEKIDAEHPRYLFPGQRKHENVIHEFRKSMLVYNLHRLGDSVDDLIIVEGFASVWWLWQCGIENVMALMGASCSQEQAKLIVDLVNPDGKIRLLPDGDEAAIRCAHDVFEKVSPHRFIRWIPLAQGRQPTDCPPDEIHALLRIAK